ncbi:MAG: cupin domain-containing protein [Planctomycetota bacterium]
MIPASNADVIDLTAITPVECPCGQARRALAGDLRFPGTLHLTDISQDARAHHHTEHTELYVIVECDDDAAIELDGVRRPVRPLHAILIPPGVVHRAVGRMRVLIICVPDFEPDDEHLASLSHYNE